MLHVVVGPGRLALGLIVPITRRCGFDVALIGRANAKDPELERYALDIPGETEGQVFQSVAYADNPVSFADIRSEELRKRLASDEPVLVTTSLDSQIGARVEFVVDLFQQRPTGSPTLLVTCENRLAPAYDRIRDAIPEAAFLESVVDRVCWSPDRIEGTPRTVVAHPVAEWVIPRPEGLDGGIVDSLDAAVEVVVVADIAAHAQRKKWTVNGLHLTLACAARIADLDRLAAREPPITLSDHADAEAFRQAAASQIEALEAIFAEDTPELGGYPQYAQDRVQVFAETTWDTVDRVLGALIRQDLRDLIGKLEQRIAAPARRAVVHGVDADPFRATVLAFLALVERRDAYFEDPQRPQRTISADVDRAAVEDFRKMLTGWLEDSTVRRYADRFQRSLERDYAKPIRLQ